MTEPRSLQPGEDAVCECGWPMPAEMDVYVQLEEDSPPPLGMVVTFRCPRCEQDFVLTRSGEPDGCHCDADAH